MKLSLVFLCLFLEGCFMTLSAQTSKIKLPDPVTRGKISLEETLSKRKSVREYTREPLNKKEISQLLWAAQGITHEGWKRTAPSAGATYPLEIYLVVNRAERLEPGLYHYLPSEHTLELKKSGKFGKKLAEAALNQEMIEKAPLDIVITALYQRTTSRYGDRGRRYVYMEAGHVGENIYLQAEALGLGTVAVGAFYDDRVKRLMGIDEEVLYIMPVGRR